jgi:hypothetical protein
VEKGDGRGNLKEGDQGVDGRTIIKLMLNK